MQNKNQLRQHYLSIRQQLSEQNRLAQQKKALETIKNFQPYQQAKTIAIYESMEGEFDITEIIKDASDNGKHCYKPIITDLKNGQMVFVNIKDNQTIPQQPIDFDLMLIPLVAFDKNNNRLGMGGGFYDRYLALYADQKPYLLGIAFTEQYCENLPHDPWDQSLNNIITQLEL